MTNRNLMLDTRDFDRVLAEAKRLGEAFPEVVNGLVGSTEALSKLGRVVMHCDSTLSARDIQVRLEPTDRLLGLVATLLARDRERLVIEESRHAAS